MLLILVLICKALASSLAPPSPMAFPLESKISSESVSHGRAEKNGGAGYLMSMVCKHWLLPKALIRLYRSDFNRESGSIKLCKTQSSSWTNCTTDSMTQEMCLAFMFVKFLPMWRCFTDLFLLTAVTTDAKSTSISENERWPSEKKVSDRV